jgi:hypothetical protein
MNSNLQAIATGVLITWAASASLSCSADTSSGGSGRSSAAGASGSAGASASAAGTSAGGDAGAASSDCIGTVVGEWDLNGVHYQSSTPSFIDGGSAYTFNMVACLGLASSEAQVLEFGYFPTPVAPATFTLDTELLADAGSAKYSGLYLDNSKAYRTNGGHTGTLTITTVDSATMTFDATFSFTGVSDDENVVSISNGVIKKLKFSVLMR